MSSPEDNELDTSPRNRKLTRIYVLEFLVVAVGLFSFMTFLNSQAVVEIRIKLQADQKEHIDKSLTIDKKEWLPDYELRFRTKDSSSWNVAGTKLNSSAKDWLVYPLNTTPPLWDMTELEVRDKDKLESDVLDMILINGTEMESNSFQYELKLDRRFDA